MKDKRVLYIVGGRSFTKNGLGRKITEVVNCWLSQVAKLDVVCGKDIYGKDSDVEYGNSSFYTAHYRQSWTLKPLVHSMSELKDIIHDHRLSKVLKEGYSGNQYDLVWERSSRLHVAGLIFAKRNKIKYTLEWKDNLVNYKFSLFKLYALFIEKIKLKHSDYIVVESDVLKKQLVSKGIEKNKVVVALNAVNVEEFKPNQELRQKFRAENGISKDRCLVGYLGSYAFYHNPQLLVKAAKIIHSEENECPPLFLMVGNGMHYEECVLLAKELGLTNQELMFLPGVSMEKVPEILAALDIAVLPGSTDIICPIKVFEYMAAETGVVLPNYFCNKDAVTQHSAIFFEPNEQESLANAIGSLILDPELRGVMARNARKECKKRYSWDSTWGQALRFCLQGHGNKNDE